MSFPSRMRLFPITESTAMRNDAVTAEGQGNIRHRQGPIRLGDGNFPEDMALGRTTVCPLSRFLSGRYSGSRTLGGVLGSYKIEGPHFAGPWLARGPSVFGAKTRLLACALLSLIWAVATWAPVRATAWLLYETNSVSLSPNPHSRIQASHEKDVSTWDAGLRCECDRSYVGFRTLGAQPVGSASASYPAFIKSSTMRYGQLGLHEANEESPDCGGRLLSWISLFAGIGTEPFRLIERVCRPGRINAMPHSITFFLPGKTLQLTCVGSRDGFSGTHKVPVQEVPGLSRRRLRRGIRRRSQGRLHPGPLRRSTSWPVRYPRVPLPQITLPMMLQLSGLGCRQADLPLVRFGRPHEDHAV